MQNDSYTLECKDCNNRIIKHSICSYLLNNTQRTLYSTNLVSSKVCGLNNFYRAITCNCVVRDLACKECGLIVGYHILQPCIGCLTGDNNGHLWIFYDTKVQPKINSVFFKKISLRKEQLELDR